MRHHAHLLTHPESILLAIGAAMLYRVTSVRQHSAASTVNAEHSLRPGLLLASLRRPRWLLGNLTDLAAFILQFLALRHGTLLVVQSLLMTGLLFTPASAVVLHRLLQVREWLRAVGLVVGLIVFLGLADPTRGHADASGAAWIVVIAGAGLVVAVLVVRAPAAPGRARARRLGAGSGSYWPSPRRWPRPPVMSGKLARPAAPPRRWRAATPRRRTAGGRRGSGGVPSGPAQ